VRSGPVLPAAALLVGAVVAASFCILQRLSGQQAEQLAQKSDEVVSIWCSFLKLKSFHRSNANVHREQAAAVIR